MFDHQHAVVAADRDRSGILLTGDDLDAGNGARAQERQHRIPVIGRPIAQLDRHRAGCAERLRDHRGAPERAGRPLKQMLEGFVEPPDAAKTGGRGDFRHRQTRVLDQLLRQQDPPRLGDRDRRGAQMLHEQTPELAAANTQPPRQGLDIRVIQPAGLDQAKGTGDRVGAAEPEGQFGRGFRPAAQAGAKSGFLCGGRGRKEAGVCPLGRRCRAERPAVDAGRRDCHEQAPIETTVAGFNGAVAGVVVHVHAAIVRLGARDVSRISDLNGGPCVPFPMERL